MRRGKKPLPPKVGTVGQESTECSSLSYLTSLMSMDRIKIRVGVSYLVRRHRPHAWCSYTLNITILLCLFYNNVFLVFSFNITTCTKWRSLEWCIIESWESFPGLNSLFINWKIKISRKPWSLLTVCVSWKSEPRLGYTESRADKWMTSSSSVTRTLCGCTLRSLRSSNEVSICGSCFFPVVVH